MKKLIPALSLFFVFFVIIAVGSCSQHKEAVIILIRHAEKDTVGGSDPLLSAAGFQRAARLQLALPVYSPDVFYSTDFNRTKATVAPWAEAVKRQIKLYDAAAQDRFADSLRMESGKTIVVAGHSNTIPALVNILARTNKYKQLPDNEYGTIFIVEIHVNGDSRVTVQRY